MWHEARKQEKKIRGMLVDYRKRAERRQHFYERIKAEPTQFLQVHGRKCKVHLDASVAAAAENPAIMMPWQGQRDNLIDRFDVRAHLDYIAPAPRQSESEAGSEPPVVEDADERSMNYERFRVLAQNEFLGIVEEKYLHQLYLEEQFGVNAQVEAETKAAAAASKKKSSAGAAIGYTYEETEMAGGSGGGGGTGSGSLGVGSSLSSSGSVPFSQSISAIEKSAEGPSPAIAGGGSSSASTGARFDECMKDESDSDLDMDVSIDINKIGTTQAHELNACGRQYGMQSNDFYSFLTKDADEADALRMAREEEQEKIMFSGRKSRRERRAQRERKFAGRPLSPPSYAAKEELVPRTFVETNDSSRSPSPVNSGKITYITSFGGEDELQAHGKISFGFSRDMSTLGGIAAGTSKAARLRSAAVASGTAGSGGGGGVVTYAEKVKQNLEKLKAQEPKEIDRKPPVQYQRQASTGRGRRGGSRRSASSSSGSSRRGGRRSRARRRSSSSSSSSSGSSSSSRSHKRGRASKSPAVGRRTRRLPDRGGRSRSPSKGRRTGGSRHAAHSRSHRRRSKSDSRSRSRSRSRTRWSPPVRRRSPRYGSRTRKATPKRSSSSSTSSSRSRSRTPPSHSHRTQTTTRAGPSKRTVSGSDSSDSSSAAAGFARKLRTQTTVPQEKKKTPLAAVITPAILSTLPLSLPPPPPPPPLPPAALSTASEAAPVEEKKPILAPLALIEPEPLVPIKRYYGRRRGDESSSDDGSSSGEDVPSKPSTVEDRKPVITGLLDPDTGCVDDSTGSSCKYPSGELGGLVQIKQEKPDTNLMAIDPLIASGGPAAGSGEGLSASLRFGKTVPGGTGASESKAGILSSGTMSTSSGAATVSGAPHSKTAFNPRDRLKRKMQILLNKQYKADKKAEIEKVERQIQQQQERDDEMRELALKLRRRQRELRHKYGTQESDRSKSHTSDERSSGDEDEAPVSMGQPRLLPPLVPPVRYAQLTGREGSCSPQRQPLLAAPHQSSPHSSSKVPSYMRQTSGSTRSEGFTGTGGYRGGSSAVIERKPVLRSDSSTMQATAIAAAAAAAVAPPSLYGGSGSGGGGGDLGRLRRRNSPTPLVPHGGPPFRGQPTGIPVPTHSMNLRRAGGGGGGPPAPGGRFDDRTRRRTPPARFNRSRSPSRERIPSGRDVGGGGGRMTGRRMDYGRSRDYDRYHHGSGGGGPQSGFSASSGGGGGGGGGGSSGRYRSARRSRSGSRGRRSRSPGRRSRSPSRGRGNGGGSSSQSGSTNSSRQTDSKPILRTAHTKVDQK